MRLILSVHVIPSLGEANFVGIGILYDKPLEPVWITQSEISI
jgi:hypothetical protein